MTKIAIKAEAIATPDLFLKALIVLPETALIAFHTDEGLLYVKDAEANAALAHLTHAGIVAEVVPEGQRNPLRR